MMQVLRRTRSVCPHCLRTLDAQYVTDAKGTVSLQKTCPEHGFFSVPAWLDQVGTRDFSSWKNAPAHKGLSVPVYDPSFATAHHKGCPFDCGLCPEHSQQTCCALLEVTSRCNMHCPVCYASAGELPADSDPDMAEVAEMLTTLRQYGGFANVQISGGEPSVRDDLPEIIQLVRTAGFPFVQLNSNGLRLARETGYAETLKEAGLDLVYLQWDGLSERSSTILRGGAYVADKFQAVHNCLQAGLPVLFVATVVRGVNDTELGDLLRTALSFGSGVRGLHLQPVASFGRHPWATDLAPRITLPELMHALEQQSNGMIQAKDFHPPSSEHALCSFSAVYQRVGEGQLTRVAGMQTSCCRPTDRMDTLLASKACTGEGDACASQQQTSILTSSENAAHKARDFVARHWGKKHDEPDAGKGTGFDAFLAQAGVAQRFTLSAMAFQDALSLDLERLRRCHIHIVTRDKRLVPFCAYNLTSSGHVPLYRGRA